jgi:uncharacterized membrane protein
MIQADVPEPRRGLLHPGLIASGATLLIAAFATDIVYWQSLLFQWNNASAWLLAAGLVLAALGAIALLVDLALRRVGRIAWLRLAALAVAALLSLLNAFVHSRDAYTAVVPEGITLSGVVALILIVVGVGGGWSLASRRPYPLAHIREVRS